MSRFRQRYRQLKWFLFLGVLLVLIGAVLAWLTHRAATEGPVLTRLHIDEDTLIRLGAMHQSTSRDGIREWTLDAVSARMLKSSDTALLETVTVRFFLENGSEILLNADTGTFDTASKDMTFSGNVEALFQGWRMRTDQLHYERKRHIVYSTTPVNIEGAQSRLSGRQIRIDLKTETVTVKGDVTAMLSPSDLDTNGHGPPSL